MERTPVESSNLVSVGYDEQARVLEIEFGGQSVYQYFDVPKWLYEELMAAPSLGEYLDKHVKKGGYRYVRVE
jgi:hypothetical protein